MQRPAWQSFMIRSKKAPSSLLAGSVSTLRISVGCRLSAGTLSLPRPPFLEISHTASTGHQHISHTQWFVIHNTNKKRWNFRKADWENFTRKIENSIPLIPRQQISIEEAYTRFMGTLSSAAHATIPRGVRPTSSSLYSMYGRRSSALLQQYEESGDPDIADNLIESLIAARQRRGKRGGGGGMGTCHPN